LKRYTTSGLAMMSSLADNIDLRQSRSSVPSLQDDAPGPTEVRSYAETMVSVVVPVYKSRETLNELADRVVRTFATIGSKFELVFVDDDSHDCSWNAIYQLSEELPSQVVAIRLMRNFGQHNALMCGFRHAQGQFIITMDDDLQNPPEEIPKLLAAIREGGYDLVYGVPIEKQHAFGRNLGSRLVNWFFRIVFRIPVTVTSFRVIRRELLDAILTYNLNFTYIDGLLAWNTQRVGQVTVEHHPRKTGRSGYSLGKLLTLAFNLFTNFSLIPLQVASGIGLVAAVLGLLTGAYYLVQALFSTIAVPGYASIIVAVLTLGGLQLLALGVIGEYVGRLHLNVNRKPQYTVRQVLSRLEPDRSAPSDDAVEAECANPMEHVAAGDRSAG
jgi:glycosyltransferase involved in cell wall biosynthesis